MGTLRQVNIKNRPHYFFNGMTNVSNFDQSLLIRGKISFKGNDAVIYNFNYIAMKSFGSVNFLSCIFNNVDVYIEESNGDKYLMFAFYRQEQKSIRKVHRTLR